MYAKVIQDQANMYERWISQLKAQEHHARMAERLVAEFPGDHYHTSIFTNDLTVSFHFKSATQLERVLRYLRGFDYRSVEGKDEPDKKCRTFKIMKRGNTLASKYAEPDIELKAYFLDDDATCRYVKVGTKMVDEIAAVEAHEVPVFELRCDDGSEVVEEPVAAG